jgi:hypothetical protein
MIGVWFRTKNQFIILSNYLILVNNTNYHRALRCNILYLFTGSNPKQDRGKFKVDHIKKIIEHLWFAAQSNLFILTRHQW